MALRTKDMVVGTVTYDPANDLFARKVDEDKWVIYFPERHETCDDADMGDWMPNENVLGQVKTPEKVDT